VLHSYMHSCNACKRHFPTAAQCTKWQQHWGTLIACAPVFAVQQHYLTVAAALLMLLLSHVPPVCRRDMLNSQEEIDEN